MLTRPIKEDFATAGLLGVSQSSLSSYIERYLRSEELDISQELSSEIFNICVQYCALDARNPTGC